MYSTDQSVKFAYSMWILPLGGLSIKTKQNMFAECRVESGEN